MPIYTVDVTLRIEADTAEQAENIVLDALSKHCDPLDIPDVTAECEDTDDDDDLELV